MRTRRSRAPKLWPGSEVVPLSAGRPESQLFAADLRFLSSILTERRVDRCNARRASSVLRTFHVIELVKRTAARQVSRQRN
jgi:hypothetical protein